MNIHVPVFVGEIFVNKSAFFLKTRESRMTIFGYRNMKLECSGKEVFLLMKGEGEGLAETLFDV